MARGARVAPVSLRYHFRQRLRAPAAAAFAWCVDFQESDGQLFPSRHTRAVHWLGEDTAILLDTTFAKGKPVRIHRLVRINADQKSWTNTHLDGPYQHSQYWYRIVPRGARASELDFTGHRLLWLSRAPSAARVRRLTAAERREDATMWRTSIAAALDRDLNRRRRK